MKCKRGTVGEIGSRNGTVGRIRSKRGTARHMGSKSWTVGNKCGTVVQVKF